MSDRPTRRLLLAAAVVGALASCSAGPAAAPQPLAAARTGEPAGVLPLPATTGAYNAAVTSSNVASTVCAGTSKYRPDSSYTSKVKRLELTTPVGEWRTVTVTAGDVPSPTDPHRGKVYRVPGYRGAWPGMSTTSADYELDHDVPLLAGGDGYDPANLFPEPHHVAGYDGAEAGSVAKDGLEDYAYLHLCRGQAPRLTLTPARRLFAGDWYRTYVRLGRPGGSGE